MLQREEIALLRGRINFIGYVITAVLLILGFRFWNAQILQFGYYQQKAEQNRIKEIPLPAPRGRIRRMSVETGQRPRSKSRRTSSRRTC